MVPYHNEEGLIDGVYQGEIYELIRRVGFNGSIRLKDWERNV